MGATVMDKGVRYYVVLHTTPGLRDAFRSPDPRAGVQGYIADHWPGPDKIAPSFEVVALPSGVGPPGGGKAESVRESRPAQVVVGLALPDAATALQFQQFAQGQKGIFAGGGADLPLFGADHWCPSEASDPIFADRAAAEVLLDVPYLRDRNGLKGANVNVVIVDQGLDGAALGSSYKGGWPAGPNLPGATQSPAPSTRRTHAMMIANNVLQVAPDVRLFDLPMVPPRITEVEDFFLNTADAAYRTMLDDIAQYRANGQFPGPWILVNAWAIYDRKLEYPPGDYTNGPLHAFNQMVVGAVGGGIDVVFAAGNCGQFCPDMRCGGLDRGPGRSILGANSLSQVLSVGAVRADTLWLGFSSQGPGQPLLGTAKPDFCAPSQFCETTDAYATNGGTSAACGLTAGVVAGLRSNPNWGPGRVSPGKLQHILNATARKTDGLPWNNRVGNGVLDARAAFDALAAQYP
jgi:subtilisin family serine protease